MIDHCDFCGKEMSWLTEYVKWMHVGTSQVTVAICGNCPGNPKEKHGQLSLFEMEAEY